MPSGPRLQLRVFALRMFSNHLFKETLHEVPTSAEPAPLISRTLVQPPCLYGFHHLLAFLPSP